MSTSAAGSPYHGYHFRSGRARVSRSGGAYNNDVINGRMIAASQWSRTSSVWDTGVMTFIVSHAGQIYQKDLGKTSASIGAAMTMFNPGPGWQKVVDAGQP